MPRLIIAGISILAGLILTIFFLINGQPIVALALALAGIYVGLSIVIGFFETLESPTFRGAAAFIGSIGIIGVFTHHRAFDADIQQAHKDTFVSFLALDQYCQPVPPRLRELRKLGIKACALQESLDQASAVVDLAKSLHLDPSLTLIDSAASLKNGSPPDYCALAYKATSAICPAAFSLLSKGSRNALLDAAE